MVLSSPTGGGLLKVTAVGVGGVKRGRKGRESSEINRASGRDRGRESTQPFDLKPQVWSYYTRSRKYKPGSND